MKVWKHFLDPSKDSINERWELPFETIEDVNNPNTNSTFAVGNVTSVSQEGRIIQMCGTCFNKLFSDLSRPSIESYMSLYANYWICSPWCSFAGSDLDTLFYVQMLFNADHVDEVYILSNMVCGNCLLNIMCYFSKFLTFRVMFRWIPRNFVKKLEKYIITRYIITNTPHQRITLSAKNGQSLL